MANITAEHLHHLARRHHATMQKVVVIEERVSTITKRSFGTLETGAGAWLGGMLEGKTDAQALGPIPLNLGIGLVLALGGTALSAGRESSVGDHMHDLGNGFIGLYLAAVGYAFGKRWKETGKVFGGGGHPWSHPYENGWSSTT